MIKKIFLFLFCLTITFYFLNHEKGRVSVIEKKNLFQKKVNPTKSYSPDTLSQTSPSPTRQLASIKRDNTQSKDWQDKLHKNLLVQSAHGLKDIKITHERTLEWKMDGVNLLVQSVVVQMHSHDGTQSSFRALVDAQTGKVLESWDRSVFDPADVREGFRFELDPRYSN